MKPIWIIDGEDVTRIQGDSVGFVRLLNALLSQQSHVGGLPDASLRLNQKDTEGDGGVDAVVDAAIGAGTRSHRALCRSHLLAV